MSGGLQLPRASEESEEGRNHVTRVVTTRHDTISPLRLSSGEGRGWGRIVTMSHGSYDAPRTAHPSSAARSARVEMEMEMSLLLASPDNDHDIKLGDLGFATEVTGPLHDLCGTPA